MANYLQHYSRIAGNEGPHSTSALNGHPAWTQDFDMQTNVALSHSFPDTFFSELPQDPFVRLNEPAPPQFQSLVLPHTLLAQDANPPVVPISSSSDLSGPLRNEPAPPEPSFPSGSGALFAQESSQVPISPNFDIPRLSQNEPALPEYSFFGNSRAFFAQEPSQVPIPSDFDMPRLSQNEPALPEYSFFGDSRVIFAQAESSQIPMYSDLDVPGLSPDEPAPLEPSSFVGLRAELQVSHIPTFSDLDVSRPFQNEPVPPELSFFVSSEALPTQEEPCQVPNSSDSGMTDLFQNEPTPPPSQSPFHNQLEVPVVRGDTTLVDDPNPLQQIPPAPSQSQVVQPNAPGPVDIDSRVCPMCNKTFARKQERDRHIETFLPHAFYCPFLGCEWRSNRHDNLQKHWGKKHPNFDPTPELQQCQIYDRSQLVNLVVCGSLTIESAADRALSEVKMNAPHLGKANVWADWWGRKPKKFKH